MANGAKESAGIPEPVRRSWDVIAIDMISRVGMVNFIIVCLVYTFLYFGTKSQHEEFIDRYILFKAPKEDSLFPFYIIGLAGFLFIGVIFYYRKKVAIKDEKISSLQKENERLQRTLLDK
jgi:hypothetical protein